MLVVERLHLLVGDVNAQLFVRVHDEILKTENVQNSDPAAFTSANNQQIIVIKFFCVINSYLSLKNVYKATEMR